MNDRQWLLGPYDGYEVTSALRKAVILADLDATLYWANVILAEAGSGAQRLLAKQAWIVAAEVVDDPVIVMRAFAVHQMVGLVPEQDHLIYLFGAMVAAPKWFESERGRAVDESWARAVGDLKDPQRRREIPHYALDRHTRRGWEVKRDEGWWDDRFSGTELGRHKTAYMYLRDGQVTTESRVECDPTGVTDDGFWAAWRRRRALLAEDLPDVPPDHEPEPSSLFEEGEEE